MNAHVPTPTIESLALPAIRTIDISHQPDRAWTQPEYLEVLYLRLPFADGYEEQSRILAEIDVVRLMEPDSDSWREWAEWAAC